MTTINTDELHSFVKSVHVLIKHSNKRIAEWHKHKVGLKEVEVLYMTHDLQDVWIKGLYCTNNNEIQNDIDIFRKFETHNERAEFLYDFKIKYDCIPQDIICLGATPNTSKPVDNLIDRRFGVKMNEFKKRKFEDIINRLAYDKYIAVIIRPKNYKPLTFY